MSCIEAVTVAKDGYGKLGGRPAHRVVWEREADVPIPEDHEIHHLCGNPRCINIRHLAAVHKAKHKTLHKLLRTHCRRGHAYKEDSFVNSEGNRVCRPCRRQRKRRN